MGGKKKKWCSPRKILGHYNISGCHTIVFLVHPKHPGLRFNNVYCEGTVSQVVRNFGMFVYVSEKLTAFERCLVIRHELIHAYDLENNLHLTEKQVLALEKLDILFPKWTKADGLKRVKRAKGRM